MIVPRVILALVLVLAATIGPASAHPHVWTSVRSTLVHDAEGRPASIRHAWTFDEMFSTFATQGLDLNGDGALDREELKDLAEVNVTSLAEFDFFTFVTAAGRDVALKPPVDYRLEHDGKALTLHFTLPVAEPAKAVPGPLKVEVYDPTFFVSFTFAEGEPVTLQNAPAGCALATRGPPKEALTDTGQVPEEFFADLEAGSAFGQQFTNSATLSCPGDAAVAEAPPEAVGEDAGQAPAGRAKAEDRAVSPQQGLGALGVIRPDGVSAASGTGLLGWIAARQAAFYQGLSSALTRIGQDGSALGVLVSLAFAYGVFHAAGPGHGKVVISSYLLASGETLRRGIAISFAAALAQALVAIAAVLTLSLILGAGAQALGLTAYWLEVGSYLFIALLGLMLLARKGGAFIGLLRGRAAPHDCGPGCDHHGHMPDPEALKGPFDGRRAAAAVLAVGLRPCTGAILVLVFALSQGILWAGVAAALAMALGTALTVSVIAVFSVFAKGAALRLASGGGAGGPLAIRGLEMAAGAAVFLFGALLLAGALSARLAA